MAEQPPPLATYDFASGQLKEAFEFLKRTRSELRMLRKVRVWKDRLEIFDINGDTFEIQNLGYLSPEIPPVLDKVNTNYKREAIHDETDSDYKEFKTGRRYAWAADRVM